MGIVGEMHAYRFLRHELGIATVTPDAWVSEIRLKALPLVTGEPDNISDSYGYDFQFIHRRTRLHVEVKSTAGDEPEFDLGISEIEAATRLARTRGWRKMANPAGSPSPVFPARIRLASQSISGRLQAVLSFAKGRNASVLQA